MLQCQKLFVGIKNLIVVFHSMNIERFTENSRSVLQKAQAFALTNHHQRLTIEHVIYCILNEEEGLVQRLITGCGAQVSNILLEIKNTLDKLPKISGEGAGQIFLSPEFAQMLEKAEHIAMKEGDSFVTTERLLQAMLLIKESEACRILQRHGVTEAKLETAITTIRRGRKADSVHTEANLEALKKYAKDLTSLAAAGRLDPVIGRDEEIRRTIQVLSRRTKNNPILIGEPGTGKTAIVEGLAYRIVLGDVPENLLHVKVMSLDLGSLVAGAKFRGEFEERLKSVLKEIVSAGTGMVLFIDELHTLVGAGAAEGAMDASNLLKPSLARGELHCIGATTLAEYRKYIEKDAALARRFQTVFVSEPSVLDTISILRGLKEKYEVHHGVRISDNAVVAAATLSSRYISDRFLPDKAIDLIDEAASRLRMQIDSKPEAIDELDRKGTQLKIEIAALEKEKDPNSRDRLVGIKDELLKIESDLLDLMSKWKGEKLKIEAIKELKAKLEQAKNDLEIAQRNGDFDKAGELMYSEMPNLTKKIQEHGGSKENAMLQETVLESDIAAIVSKWTGIPVDKMLSSEKERLLHMEGELEKIVVGQRTAVVTVSNAIRRARVGLSDKNRPIGSFLLLGPTGVGKTELTKALAQFLFDDQRAIVRIDMSEFMEKHAVARLIGAPPGYVGYEEGGMLTEAVRRRPYQVILFDEVEKAHAEVFNILLQVLDEGRLTDGQGRTVDFRNTLLILTSNLGANYMVNLPEDSSIEIVRKDVMQVVHASFKPEFLNRLDSIILFNRLTRDNMKAIVDIQLERLEQLLQERRILIEFEQTAKLWLIDRGYDPAYGARPLKRVIQESLQNKIAEMLLSDEVGEGDTIIVSHVEGESTIRVARKERE